MRVLVVAERALDLAGGPLAVVALDHLLALARDAERHGVLQMSAEVLVILDRAVARLAAEYALRAVLDRVRLVPFDDEVALAHRLDGIVQVLLRPPRVLEALHLLARDGERLAG